MEEDDVTLEDLLHHGGMDLTCWEDDELALRLAARSGRHPFNEMTSLEKRCFADVYQNPALLRVYLYIRNKILQLWYLEPNVEVTWETVANRLPEPFNTQRDLLRRIMLYLNRYGYINFGIFYKLSVKTAVKNGPKLAVIGGGIAGIMAAKQLQSFGLDVILFEANSHLGGRCHTTTLPFTPDATNFAGNPSTFGIDFGAEFISGLQGNPLLFGLRQLGGHPMKLSSTVHCFDGSGKPVDCKKMELVIDIYQKLIDALLYIVNVKGTTELDGQVLSVQKTFDRLLSQLELENLKQQDQYWDMYSELLDKLQDTTIELKELDEASKVLESKSEDLERLKNDVTVNEANYDLMSRFQFVDMTRFIKLHETAKERRATLIALLKDLKKNQPSEVFMNHKDKRILEWNFANLEGTIGATLDQVAAEFFDPSVADRWRQSPICLKEGLGHWIRRLAQVDKILLNSTVTDITYDKKVTVKFTRAMPPLEDEPVKEVVMIDEELHFDAVICAVPLGVLKKNAIKFHPALPDAKKEAIEKLGFGVMNKVVLVFDKAFWSNDVNFWSHYSPNSSSRGEFYMITGAAPKPVLTLLMAGTAAYCEQPDEIIVSNAMNVLKNIFGAISTPKQPKEAIITRWHQDKNFYGSNSFLKTGSNPAMYDRLAEPVAVPSVDPKKPYPYRVFFAGEHTYRHAPASVPGAFLSGLRAAAEVADQFLGQPFVRNPNSQEECVNISDSDDETDPNVSQTTAANDDDDVQILS